MHIQRLFAHASCVSQPAEFVGNLCRVQAVFHNWQSLLEISAENNHTATKWKDAVHRIMQCSVEMGHRGFIPNDEFWF